MKSTITKLSNKFKFVYSPTQALTLIIFGFSNFLILLEQLKRLGVGVPLAIAISLIVPIIVSWLLIRSTSERAQSVIELKKLFFWKNILAILVFTLFWCFIVAPIILGNVAFETSWDSGAYHAQIVKSLGEIGSSYSLNNTVLIYSHTYFRGGEALVTMVNLLLPGFTFLQAQVIILYILFLISLFVLSKRIGLINSMAFHFIVLLIPTIYFQVQTNYTDIFQLPLGIIGISYIFDSKSKRELFLGVIWISMLAGTKTSLVPLGFITILVALIVFYFKQKDWMKKELLFSIVLSIVIFILPFILLLAGNYVYYRNPFAPYKMLFFTGEDINETNFIPNRYGLFSDLGEGEDSALKRFFYSHVTNSTNYLSQSYYDARLGGGGLIFVIFMILGVFLFFRTARKFIKVKFEFLKEKKLLTDFSLIIIFFVSVVIIPETHWFRYIIFPFTILAFYVISNLNSLNKKYLYPLWAIIFIVGLFQIIQIKNVIIPTELSGSKVLNIITYQPRKDENNTKLIYMKTKLSASDNVLYIIVRDTTPENVLWGNGLSMLNISSTIDYKYLSGLAELEEVCNYEANGYDVVIISKINLPKLTNCGANNTFVEMMYYEKFPNIEVFMKP